MHEIDECNGDSISIDVLSFFADKNLTIAIESIFGYKKFEVIVDTKIVNIVNDNDILEYKSYSDNEIAYLSFCVATNMGKIAVYNIEMSFMTSSFSFLHMLFNITISLYQWFEVTSVDIAELSISRKV